jgi:hypothetical protein
VSRATSPFSPAAIAAVLLVGGGAFLLFLYAIGAGWSGDRMRVTAHANSDALDGYTALVDMLERRGHTVSVSREQLGSDAYDTLLVLTPAADSDPAELQALIEARQYVGPTVVILPKWQSMPLPANAPGSPPDDWVQLQPGYTASLFEGVELFAPLTLEQGNTAGWSGLGLRGDLPIPAMAQAITEVPGKELIGLIADAEGDLLAGYWNRGGYHPELAAAAGVNPAGKGEDGQDPGLYPLILVAEPDLLNNYGMADEARARAAVALIELAAEGEDPAVVFDLTLPGLGASDNLLTLAFRPPFLAATLCLLAAMLMVAWRAFRRFGPPLAEAPELALGKTQLARNGAALVQRTRRWHLLGAPYAAMIAARIATALQIREGDQAPREAAIDAAMASRGIAAPHFSSRAEALRTARRPADIVRAAHALRSIERTLVR